MAIRSVKRGPASEDGEQSYEVKETALKLAPWDAQSALRIVGRDQRRLEGPDKVTGRAQYTYDIRLPGQLYARVLRSPHPHARIRSIDTSAAAALPGVHAVISSADAPEIKWYEESVLFDPRVRYIGDEVAAVAAESEEIADDALRLIRVEYDVLSFVSTMDEALATGAPKLHGNSNRAGKKKSYQRGDVERGFAQADVIIEQTYITQSAMHNALEPHGSTASWEGDRLTLWDSTQGIWAVRKEVAERLKIPSHNVRVIKQFMGGGFGAKQVPWKNTVIAALLSQRSGRPVQLMLDRRAENLAAGNRNPTRQHVRLGAKRDGTITAISVDVFQQVGAYMVGGEASDPGSIYTTLYHCPNVATTQTGVYTNTGPAVAFRAPGHVEGAFGLESAMDELARALGMDPIELRLRNYTAKDQQEGKPFTTPDSLRLCYEAAADAFGWHDYKRNSSGSKRRGIGFAAHDWAAGGGNPPGYAWIKLNSDGTADVVTATQDIGTGTRTGLIQVAAEELGLPVESIALQLGDTANGPYSPTSAGSSTQATIGPAVRAAAAEAKRQLLVAAADLLETTPDKLDIENGRVCMRANPRQGMAVAEVTAAIDPHMIQATGSWTEKPSDKAVRTFGAQCAEVEVDIETGEVTVLRVVAAHDCGRLINPLLVRSQVIGAVTQGMGYALLEERIVDERFGVVLNANLEEYKVPTMPDIPQIIHAGIDVPDIEANPTGAKGIGEPPLVPTAPAIANAIFDATGVRLREAPLARRRILAGLYPAVHDAPDAEGAQS